MSKKQSEFCQKVLQLVASIPYGKVASYGQIAAYADHPSASRQVGGILRTHDDLDLPWWRVVNRDGQITIKNMFHAADEQRARLQAEGIQVNKDYKLDIAHYRWELKFENAAFQFPKR